MVFRPQGDGSHRVIGPCWVDGFMHGEAIGMLKNGEHGLEAENFVLR